MLNYLWAGMMMLGIIYAAFTGRMPDITNAALDSSKEAITLCITMIGIMSFWVGLMEIATKAGIIEQLSRKLKPLIHFLFPNLPDNHPAATHITTNIIANILGLGWAATPAGLNAMEELKNLEERLPELVQQAEEGTKLEEKAGEANRKKNSVYSRVSERVGQALKQFQKMEDTQKDLEGQQNDLNQAKQNTKAVQEQKEQLTAQIADWKKQEMEKQAAPIQLARWESQQKSVERLNQEVADTKDLEEAWNRQKKTVVTTQQKFREASLEYRQEQERYEAMRQIFFNMQAGLIAREQLKPGQPCPVCGSLEHPAPCELAEEHSTLTREKLDEMSVSVEERRKEQESCAWQMRKKSS